MPVREINIIPIVNRVLEASQELFPTAVVDIANLLIDKSYEYGRNEAILRPQRKDGSPSLWGERYANTLKVETMTGKGGTARVYVDESHPDYLFVEMVENGVNTWSIKEALLAGKAARRNKALYGTAFVRVPFRYHTPTKQRVSSTFAGVMPLDVYEAAKKDVSLGKEYGQFAGLKKYGEGVHSQYFTFRTVSANSKGWIFPNKPATPVFSDVEKRVERMIEKAMVDLIKGVEKDLKKQFEK